MKDIAENILGVILYNPTSHPANKIIAGPTALSTISHIVLSVAKKEEITLRICMKATLRYMNATLLRMRFRLERKPIGTKNRI